MITTPAPEVFLLGTRACFPQLEASSVHAVSRPVLFWCKTVPHGVALIGNRPQRPKVAVKEALASSPSPIPLFSTKENRAALPVLGIPAAASISGTPRA